MILKIDLLVSLEITQDTVYFLCYSKYRCNMRLNAVLMLVLIASMSGSIAYANNSNQPDTSKMSYELISALDSTDEIEVIIQFTEEQDSSVWQSFETMGIQMISELSVLHGGLLVGTPTTFLNSLRFYRDIWRLMSPLSTFICREIKIILNP